MTDKTIDFGFAIVYTEDAYWIAKKTDLQQVTPAGSIVKVEGFVILKNLDKNGFEVLVDALAYLSQCVIDKGDKKNG